jgi:hypothetical protein
MQWLKTRPLSSAPLKTRVLGPVVFDQIQQVRVEWVGPRQPVFETSELSGSGHSVFWPQVVVGDGLGHEGAVLVGQGLPEQISAHIVLDDENPSPRTAAQRIHLVVPITICRRPQHQRHFEFRTVALPGRPSPARRCHFRGHLRLWPPNLDPL